MHDDIYDEECLARDADARARCWGLQETLDKAGVAASTFGWK